MSLIEIRLRPTGPWRAGHRTGDRERADAVYHSDALYSAVTHAMQSLGWLDEWLDATARNETGSAVRFSSLFPFVGETRLLPPPRTAWPPSGSKLYVNAAKLVPVEVARRGMLNESRWAVDGASECLLPIGMPAPFSVSMRAAAAVDRLTGHTEPHRTACLEFAPNAGWWGLIEFPDVPNSDLDSDPHSPPHSDPHSPPHSDPNSPPHSDPHSPPQPHSAPNVSEGNPSTAIPSTSIPTIDWEPRVKSALRLLADSGFGGERSRGWGRAHAPEFSDAASLFGEGHPGAWWMLSLYSPHTDDAVDWARGDYSTVTRAGWTDSAAGSVRKRHVRMIEEGSVLMAPVLRGRAVDVAPEGFPHPAWRSGFALAVPVPLEVEA